MNSEPEKRYAIDLLAAKAGGYVSPPSQEDIEFTNLFFENCRRFKVQYSQATPEDQEFVTEVTRIAWETQQAKKSGSSTAVQPAFTLDSATSAAWKAKLMELVAIRAQATDLSTASIEAREAACLIELLSEDEQQVALAFLKDLAANRVDEVNPL